MTTATTTPTIVIGSSDIPRDDSVVDYQPQEVKGIVYEVAPTKPQRRER